MMTFRNEVSVLTLEQLILQMGQGSTLALEPFYEQTRASVFAFALSILGDRHSAEDVMQETYLRVYQGAGNYTAMGKPMAWLLTITKNLAFQKLRGDKSAPEELDEQLPAPGFETCTLDRLTLQTALEALSREEREIVTLHAVAGFKHRETAAMLELPLATVLSKYHRALSKLRRILKEEG